MFDPHHPFTYAVILNLTLYPLLHTYFNVETSLHNFMYDMVEKSKSLDVMKIGQDSKKTDESVQLEEGNKVHSPTNHSSAPSFVSYYFIASPRRYSISLQSYYGSEYQDSLNLSNEREKLHTVHN